MAENLNNGKKFTALIVEDNIKMRTAIRKMLKTQFKNKIAGVFECENGRDAAEFYPRHKPDWIIMDIKMPVMDGLKASGIIMQSYPDAKIIILTQYDDPGYHEIAQKIGVKAFVLKENLSDISTIISSML